MPETDLPGGGGLRFRCNGQAFPATPAVCTRGTLRTSLDAEGQPTLPYEPVGNSPIPD
jgi:branched-chain amino acid transport system substrate-binding protein